MESNIKLENNGVVKIEGNSIKATTHDFMLDNPRRRINTNGQRRSLVHDFTDGLTINWNSDYPGGVSIKGNTQIEKAKFSKEAVFCDEVIFQKIVTVSKRLIIDKDATLYVSGNANFENAPIVDDVMIAQLGEVINVRPNLGVGGLNIPIGALSTRIPVSLSAIITSMQEEIKNLKNRISNLEAGS